MQLLDNGKISGVAFYYFNPYNHKYCVIDTKIAVSTKKELFQLWDDPEALFEAELPDDIKPGVTRIYW